MDTPGVDKIQVCYLTVLSTNKFLLLHLKNIKENKAKDDPPWLMMLLWLVSVFSRRKCWHTSLSWWSMNVVINDAIDFITEMYYHLASVLQILGLSFRKRCLEKIESHESNGVQSDFYLTGIFTRSVFKYKWWIMEEMMNCVLYLLYLLLKFLLGFFFFLSIFYPQFWQIASKNDQEWQELHHPLYRDLGGKGVGGQGACAFITFSMVSRHTETLWIRCTYTHSLTY